MRLFSLALAAIAVPVAAHATPIAFATGGSSLAPATYQGQSFTVTGTGSYNDITFNFFSDAASTKAFAAGNGYIFSTFYTGTESELGTATVNLVGKAASSNGLYTFTPSMDLMSGVKYYFYEDASIANMVYGANSYAGGNSIYSYSPSSTYHTDASLNFAVNSQPITPVVTVTPEPSSIALIGTGLVGIFGVTRRKFARA